VSQTLPADVFLQHLITLQNASMRIEEPTGANVGQTIIKLIQSVKPSFGDGLLTLIVKHKEHQFELRKHFHGVLSEQDNHKATERPLGGAVCRFSDHHKARRPFDMKDAQRAAGDALIRSAEFLNHLPVLMTDSDDYSALYVGIMQKSIIDAASITDSGAECRLIEESSLFTGAETNDSIGGVHGGGVV
jgi:hypothetical protein